MELNETAYELHLAAARAANRRKDKKAKPVIIRRGRNPKNKKAVTAIQERLSNLGFAVDTDGIFGPQTERAVKAFQRHAGIQKDGQVGPQTIRKLATGHKLKTPEADIGIDAIEKTVTPENVANQQGQHRREGKALGDATAIINGGGKKTGIKKAASKAKGTKAPAKGSHGGSLDAEGHEIASAKTGPIGSTTIQKPTKMTNEPGGSVKEQQAAQPKQSENNNPEFNALHPRDGGKFVAKGSSGEGVTNTQSALNEVDGAGLEKDGKFGDKTEAAVKAFQAKAGLTVDGIVGAKTSASLRRRLKIVQKSKQT